jgi:hypothetical protein
MRSLPIAHRIRAQRAAEGREGGAVLILALVFLTVILVLALSLLNLAFTGASTTQQFREQRLLRYNGEAALQGAIQFLKTKPEACVRPAEGDCATNVSYPLMVEHLAGSSKGALFPGSFLRVLYTTNGADSGTIDTDGGQRPRDVTIRVVCDAHPSQGRRQLLRCGNGSQQRIVAQARVRFEVNYDPGTAVVATDQTKRAYVPKIQSWWVVS